MDRMYKRLSALGFRSSFAPATGVAWDPILKSLGAAALVLATAWLIAAKTIPGIVQNLGFPTTTVQVLHTLVIILIVHMVATVAALSLRARLIGSDKYFSDSGSPLAVAFVKLFVKCAIVSFGCYLVLNVESLISALADTASPATDTTSPPIKLTPAEIICTYLRNYSIWAIVPACCGMMIAYAIERSDENSLGPASIGRASRCDHGNRRALVGRTHDGSTPRRSPGLRRRSLWGSWISPGLHASGRNPATLGRSRAAPTG